MPQRRDAQRGVVHREGAPRRARASPARRARPSSARGRHLVGGLRGQQEERGAQQAVGSRHGRSASERGAGGTARPAEREASGRPASASKPGGCLTRPRRGRAYWASAPWPRAPPDRAPVTHPPPARDRIPAMGTQGKQHRRRLPLRHAALPFGTFGGTLKDFSRHRPGRGGGAGRRSRRPASPADEVDHVVFGNALQTSKDAIYLARHVGLRAGLPQEVPGAHGQPPLRLGLPGVVGGRDGDPARRGGGGALRRHRVDEPGPARGPRRALGRPAARARPVPSTRTCSGSRSPTPSPAARWR